MCAFFQDVKNIEMTAGNEVEPDHVKVRANLKDMDDFYVFCSSHRLKQTGTSHISSWRTESLYYQKLLHLHRTRLILLVRASAACTR